MAQSSETNPLALLSLICGILSWVAFPILGSLAAIVSGHAALKQLRSPLNDQNGEVLAKAGLILGWLQIAVIVLITAFYVGLILLAGALSGLGIIALVILGLAAAAGLLGLLAMLIVAGA
ncbi:MAG: DUF4190 domain-containing protein [Pseudomonadota bacterium]